MGTSLTLPRSAGASNIMVGWICPGDVTNSFASALVDTLVADPLHRITGKISLQSSPRIVQARTDMVDGFMQTNCEWLLMIDADMMWTYQDFDKLCRSADAERRPIVGGLCFAGGRTNSQNIYPTLYSIKLDAEGQLDSEIIFDYPRNKLTRVSATGAAFLLVHRRVFMDMLKAYGQNNPFPWFNEIIARGKALGEDIAFCVRATSLDYQIYVHTGVLVGHEKRYLLTEQLYDDTRRSSERDRQGAAAALHGSTA